MLFYTFSNFSTKAILHFSNLFFKFNLMVLLTICTCLLAKGCSTTENSFLDIILAIDYFNFLLVNWVPLFKTKVCGSPNLWMMFFLDEVNHLIVYYLVEWIEFHLLGVVINCNYNILGLFD